MVWKVAATVLGLLLTAISFTPVAAQEQSAAPAAAPAGSRASAVVNLNTATAAQLETLPGIGPKTAARIIEHRQKVGGFKKIEELMNVRGVGEKSFLKLKPHITVAALKTNSQ